MGACMYAKRGNGLNMSVSEPLLDNEGDLLDWELKSKSREKMEEDMSQFPRFVLLGLEEYAQENMVRLVRINENGILSHFAAPPEELKSLFENDEYNTYRSPHAMLYHVVNGEYPGKESHKTWFGWSTRRSNPKFYCYTLNSADGWITEKARRRATMTDLQDLVSAKNFELLIADFEKRDMSKTLDIDPLVDAFEKAHEEMVEEVSDSGEESGSLFTQFGRLINSSEEKTLLGRATG